MDAKSASANYEKKDIEVDVHNGNEKLYIDPVHESRLLRKMDMFLVPIFGMVYLLGFLDRGNIGNAKTAGLNAALHLTDNQYAACVSVLYATYVTFECVYPTLVKLVTAKVVLSIATTIFGILTLVTAWVRNYQDLAAIRILLGIVEAGIFPCVVTYLAMTYRRQELGRRLSYIFSCAALSGAFGGLIAYGLVQIKTGHIQSWQWIYIVEGIISILFAPVLYFAIPDRIDTAWFLHTQERQLATARYQSMIIEYNVDEKFDWKQIRAAVMDWTTYAGGSVQFAADVALYGISTFMPVFIKDFGYSTVRSNLLTVPVYIFGAISFLLQAQLSDRWKARGPFIFVNTGIQLVGYIVLASVSHPAGVRYFGLFIVALGLYVPTGLNVGWTQNNHAPHFKRAFALGLMQLIGNSAGAAIGYIFFDSPRYHRGFSIACGLNGYAMLMTAFLFLHYRRQNAKKQAAIRAGAPNQPELGDRNPHFAYYI